MFNVIVLEQDSPVGIIKNTTRNQCKSISSILKSSNILHKIVDTKVRGYRRMLGVLTEEDRRLIRSLTHPEHSRIKRVYQRVGEIL